MMNTRVCYPKKESYTSMPGFSNLMDTIWKNEFPGLFTRNWEGSTVIPSVNIIEGKESFKIELAAPGLAKEDFKIKVEENVLSISCEKKRNEERTEENYTRQEFSYNSFTRSFTLPETVNSEKIGAEYKDGILTVSLPKKEEAKVVPTREIQVS